MENASLFIPLLTPEQRTEERLKALENGYALLTEAVSHLLAKQAEQPPRMGQGTVPDDARGEPHPAPQFEGTQNNGTLVVLGTDTAHLERDEE